VHGVLQPPQLLLLLAVLTQMLPQHLPVAPNLRVQLAGSHGQAAPLAGVPSGQKQEPLRQMALSGQAPHVRPFLPQEVSDCWANGTHVVPVQQPCVQLAQVGQTPSMGAWPLVRQMQVRSSGVQSEPDGHA
jgi:hypothetical protein